MFSTVEIEIYGRPFLIPDYRGSNHSEVNLFPSTLRGDVAYGQIAEQTSQVMLIEHAKDDYVGLFFDIGAYCGIYCQLLSDYCGVVGFEPNPLIFDLLKHNLDNLNYAGLAECVGLSDDMSEKRFVPAKDMRGASDLVLHGHGDIQVDMTTLDDYGMCPGLMKIDVEGMAHKVLAGGKETLASVNFVVLEVHSQGEYDGSSALLNNAGLSEIGHIENHHYFRRLKKRW